MLHCVPTFTRPMARGPLGLLTMGLSLFTSVTASKPAPFGGNCGNVTTPLPITTGQRHLKVDFFGYTAWADFEIGIDKPRPKRFPPASVFSFGPLPPIDPACTYPATSFSNSTNVESGRVPAPPDLGPRFDLVVSSLQPVPERWHTDDGEDNLRGRLRSDFRTRQLRRQLDIAGKTAEKRERDLHQQLDLLTQQLAQREAELLKATSTFGGLARKLGSSLFSTIICAISSAVLFLILPRRAKSASCFLLHKLYKDLRALSWPVVGSAVSSTALVLLSLPQSLARRTLRWITLRYTFIKGSNACGILRSFSWPVISSALSSIIVALFNLLQSFGRRTFRWGALQSTSDAKSPRTKSRNRRNANATAIESRHLDIPSASDFLSSNPSRELASALAEGRALPLITLGMSKKNRNTIRLMQLQLTRAVDELRLASLPDTISHTYGHPIIAAVEQYNCQSPSIWDDIDVAPSKAHKKRRVAKSKRSKSLRGEDHALNRSEKVEKGAEEPIERVGSSVVLG